MHLCRIRVTIVAFIFTLLLIGSTVHVTGNCLDNPISTVFLTAIRYEKSCTDCTRLLPSFEMCSNRQTAFNRLNYLKCAILVLMQAPHPLQPSQRRIRTDSDHHIMHSIESQHPQLGNDDDGDGDYGDDDAGWLREPLGNGISFARDTSLKGQMMYSSKQQQQQQPKPPDSAGISSTRSSTVFSRGTRRNLKLLEQVFSIFDTR